jgi:hypothetical protein
VRQNKSVLWAYLVYLPAPSVRIFDLNQPAVTIVKQDIVSGESVSHNLQLANGTVS